MEYREFMFANRCIRQIEVFLTTATVKTDKFVFVFIFVLFLLPSFRMRLNITSEKFYDALGYFLFNRDPYLERVKRIRFLISPFVIVLLPILQSKYGKSHKDVTFESFDVCRAEGNSLLWMLAPFLHNNHTHLMANLIPSIFLMPFVESLYGSISFIAMCVIGWASGILWACRSTRGFSAILFSSFGIMLSDGLGHWWQKRNMAFALFITYTSIALLAINITPFYDPAVCNWCHVGGYIGGVGVGFATLSINACIDGADRFAIANGIASIVTIMTAISPIFSNCNPPCVL